MRGCLAVTILVLCPAKGLKTLKTAMGDYSGKVGMDLGLAPCPLGVGAVRSPSRPPVRRLYPRRARKFAPITFLTLKTIENTRSLTKVRALPGLDRRGPLRAMSRRGVPPHGSARIPFRRCGRREHGGEAGTAFANVPTPYNWSTSPPRQSREAFVEWMVKNRGEDPRFLGQRFDRLQQLIGHQDIWDETDIAPILMTPREDS